MSANQRWRSGAPIALERRARPLVRRPARLGLAAPVRALAPLSTASSSASGAAPAASGVTHVVQSPAETLSSVAAKYQVSVRDLKVLNFQKQAVLKGDALQPGQTLRIPARKQLLVSAPVPTPGPAVPGWVAAVAGAGMLTLVAWKALKAMSAASGAQAQQHASTEEASRPLAVAATTSKSGHRALLERQLHLVQEHNATVSAVLQDARLQIDIAEQRLQQVALVRTQLQHSRAEALARLRDRRDRHVAEVHSLASASTAVALSTSTSMATVQVVPAQQELELNNSVPIPAMVAQLATARRSGGGSSVAVEVEQAESQTEVPPARPPPPPGGGNTSLLAGSVDLLNRVWRRSEPGDAGGEVAPTPAAPRPSDKASGQAPNESPAPADAAVPSSGAEAAAAAVAAPTQEATPVAAAVPAAPAPTAPTAAASLAEPPSVVSAVDTTFKAIAVLLPGPLAETVQSMAPSPPAPLAQAHTSTPPTQAPTSTPPAQAPMSVPNAHPSMVAPAPLVTALSTSEDKQEEERVVAELEPPAVVAELEPPAVVAELEPPAAPTDPAVLPGGSPPPLPLASRSPLEAPPPPTPATDPAPAVDAPIDAGPAAGSDMSSIFPPEDMQGSSVPQPSALATIPHTPKAIEVSQVLEAYNLRRGLNVQGPGKPQQHEQEEEQEVQEAVFLSLGSESEDEGPWSQPKGPGQAAQHDEGRQLATGPPSLHRARRIALLGSGPTMTEVRTRLKTELLDVVYTTMRGLVTTPEQRAAAEELACALECRNPTLRPTDCLESMAGRWKLVYTTSPQTQLLLSALDSLPLLELGEVYQEVDTASMTVCNKIDIKVPMLLTLRADASLEQRTPRALRLRVERVGLDTFIKAPQLLAALDVPESLELWGNTLDLTPIRRYVVDPFNAVLETSKAIINRAVSPELDVQATEASSLYMLTTYLDSTLRITRDESGHVFVMLRDVQ